MLTERRTMSPARAEELVDELHESGDPVDWTSFDETRRVAKDWRLFSSELNAEPFIRPYRQFPLEADPPDHTAYRAIVAPFFERGRLEGLAPAMRAIAADLVAGALARGSCEAVADLALPMVVRSLVPVLGRSAADADIWMAWGPDVYLERGGSLDASHLHAYLAEAFRGAMEAPGDDVFGRIASARIGDRRLTREEMYGLGDLVLAGGRDTIVMLLSGAIWHLALHPSDRRRLADDPEQIPTAVEEFLRYLSPLGQMPRIATSDANVGPREVRAGDPVRVNFRSANLDPDVFEEPLRCRIDRSPNRHLAFGYGAHTCTGAHLARLEARLFLEALLASGATIRMSGDPDIVWREVALGLVPIHIRSVPIGIER